MPSPLKKALHTYLDRGTARWSCLVILYLPFALYFLFGLGQSVDRPPALDVGVVAVAAALGGLVLNAGLNLTGPKRKETVQVAQKFIAVVILMVIFLPALHFVDLMGGIDLNSFEPASMEAWARGFFFWLGAVSFYVGIGLFIVALVDLVYAMMGIENIGDAAKGNDEGEV